MMACACLLVLLVRIPADMQYSLQVMQVPASSCLVQPVAYKCQCDALLVVTRVCRHRQKQMHSYKEYVSNRTPGSSGLSCVP